MLSVIIPAYNEELSIERAYYTISDILKEAEIPCEFIFVDDVFICSLPLSPRSQTCCIGSLDVLPGILYINSLCLICISS